MWAHHSRFKSTCTQTLVNLFWADWQFNTKTAVYRGLQRRYNTSDQSSRSNKFRESDNFLRMSKTQKYIVLFNMTHCIYSFLLVFVHIYCTLPPNCLQSPVCQQGSWCRCHRCCELEGNQQDHLVDPQLPPNLKLPSHSPAWGCQLLDSKNREEQGNVNSSISFCDYLYKLNITLFNL